MDHPHEIVAEHVRRAFIRAFGAARFEVWRGKDGLAEHSATELAESVTAALLPLLERSDVSDVVLRLHRSGELAPPIGDPGPL